ncbi:accessory gland protein Acp29AB-like [Drosophila biarmipes]|uniref:accessory gland protein Acp29AB-like n=1 Tax=Drosophila biarmipes TaxID=125945 RepID=UPI0007E681B7|nr:accessory gland protein Acp29AB-like [Drosophila biarmipes]
MLGRRIENRLMALQVHMEGQLRVLRNILETRIEHRKIADRINKAVFQKIGSRYFYVEKKNKESWYSAADRCRQLGGHLATIQDEWEMDNVFSGVQPGSYWVDIYSLGGDEGPYFSSLSGKEVKYFKWGIDLPKFDHNHCVNNGD